jgi:hypothetical protein
MSCRNADVAALLKSFEGGELPPNYCCFFACFNRQWFFEAHEVLEKLWLGERGRPEADFYKGLIQLAGAFVHLQRNRMRPAGALFKLARANLEKYPAREQGLDTLPVRKVIEEWLVDLEAGGFRVNPLLQKPAPRLNSP